MNGSPNVTLIDIAEKLNLSVKAVSTALNYTGRLAPKTRQMICETARTMGYTPNAAARALVTKKSDFFGVIIPLMKNSFFGRIIAGIEKAATARGYTLLIECPPAGPAQLEAMLDRLSRHQTAGVILHPSVNLRPAAEWFKFRRIPNPKGRWTKELPGKEQFLSHSSCMILAAEAAGIEHAITFEFSHFMSPNSMYLSAGNLRKCYLEWVQSR